MEAVDEEGRPVAERAETGTSVKTPSPLGEHGDGTEDADASGAESSKASTAGDGKTKDDSKDSKDDFKDDSKDAKDANGSKSNGKGNNEPKRGRNKKKGKK